MNQNLTEIAFVMDRSGSMESMKEEAIVAFNQFLKDQRELPGEARLTLVLFDTEFLKPYDNVPIEKVPDLNEKTYIPRAGTALLDAMGKTIDEIGKRLAATAEADRPCKVIVACMTDGEENSSRQYSNDAIAAIIRHQQEKYSWEFVFLGATIDSRRMASSWNLKDEDVHAVIMNKENYRKDFMLLRANISRKRMQSEMPKE
ncbi:MAG: vWA domain-containing protein [bacterium]